MSNSIATTNSKLDIRVKEPSGVVPAPSGPGSLDHFSMFDIDLIKIVFLMTAYNMIFELYISS